VGEVVCKHRRNPASPKGTDERKCSCDRKDEGDNSVGPGQSLTGSREVLQTL